jgi:Lar family restriction alleviation protein
MPELKPCPFCGGKAFFNKLYDAYDDEEYCIACTDCDCVFTVTYKNPDKSDLAEAWNRRVQNENA